MIQYVQVTEDNGDEPIELPSEEDGTILLSTLAAQYPGACGLKYHPEPCSMRWRGIRLADGKLHPPEHMDGQWGNIKYVVNLVPKEGKRKGDDGLENPHAKTKRVENKKCSDLIVLGLPWKTTKEEVKKYFGKFGEVLMVQIKTELHTNKSKGYGFIRFSEYEAQLACLKERHYIDGRRCEVRIPNSKVGNTDCGPRKVFVGRTTENMTADDLRQYFSRFGDVTDVFIPKPFRAFAFVTFADSEVAHELLGNDYLIDGVSVHVCAASPKNDKNQEKRKSDSGSVGGYRDDRGDNYNQQKGGGGGGNWSNHMGNPGRGGNDGNMGGNMGGNMNMGMGGMGMGQFLNPAMVAAALSQTPWGLLGLANQGGGGNSAGGGDCNNPMGGGGGNPNYCGGGGGGGGNSSGYNSGNNSSSNNMGSNNGFFGGGWGSGGGSGGSGGSDSGNSSGWGNMKFDSCK